MGGETPQVEVRVEGLTKAFGEHVVLDRIDLTIRRGEIVAIVGMSGSGKTVLLDLMTGLVEPDAGRVLIADHAEAEAPLEDIHALDEDAFDALRLHWAIVFQRNALFSATVRENCALWLRENARMSERDIEERVRWALGAAALDVDDVIDKHRDALSGGMAKRVAIARAIAMDPALIFYDEPTTGLDPIVAGEIHELIWSTHNLARRGGGVRTSVVVTHDKELLRRLRPRVVMLHDGGVAYDGPYDEFGKNGREIAREYLAAMPVLQARPTG
ncbi:MAG: ATP-binding cassette domain-containing protein [Phycisphaerales bacterium]